MSIQVHDILKNGNVMHYSVRDHENCAEKVTRGTFCRVMSGMVLVRNTNNATCFHVCAPGEYFGWQALQPSSGSCEGVFEVLANETSIMRWKGTDVRTQFQDNPELATGMVDLLLAKLAEQSRIAEIVRAHPMPRRIGLLFLLLGERLGYRFENPDKVAIFRFTQGVIAKMAGASNREMATIALGKLKQAGLLSYPRKQNTSFTIPSVTALRQFCGKV